MGNPLERFLIINKLLLLIYFFPVSVAQRLIHPLCSNFMLRDCVKDKAIGESKLKDSPENPCPNSRSL